MINYGNVEYLDIVSFDEIKFSYGLNKKGWVINDDGVVKVISFTESNFIDFLKVLEMPFDKIEKDIRNSLIKKKIEIDFSWVDLFPIEGMIKTAFSMESSYWGELCLDFLVKSNFISEKIMILFEKSNKEKWFSQKMRHQIKKYSAAFRTRSHGNDTK
ncbi:hypothetical protein [Flavobacterium oreochromis]|uniref:hypothetical protein n=1 Tax=Flavobacterium oreochromis TaxID=2906078 RepID=UPI00385D2630